MNKPIKKDGNKKLIILVTIILAVIAIFGITVVSTMNSDNSADHGHSHDQIVFELVGRIILLRKNNRCQANGSGCFYNLNLYFTPLDES